eukprot:3304581-Amphidinium_carterae.1
MDYLQWKGRWSTQKSMRHYMQMGLGAASFSTLEPGTKDRIMTLAAFASPLISQLAKEKNTGEDSGGARILA